MNKCAASKDGVCQNAYAFGMKCDGYSAKCRLKPVYDNLERTVLAATETIRQGLGIVSDKEE